MCRICYITEQYDQAICDFKECLKIQSSILEPSNRCLAETFYQLGTAHTLACNYKDALESYTSAIEVMKMKIGTILVLQIVFLSYRCLRVLMYISIGMPDCVPATYSIEPCSDVLRFAE